MVSDSGQLDRIIMWLKEDTPSKKSFNVETINFTENKRVETVLFGSCCPTRKDYTEAVSVSSPTSDMMENG